MRLTLINQFYTPDISPTAHLCASLAEHRAAMGDHVTVVTGRGGYIAPVGSSADLDSGVNVIRLWTTQLRSQSLLRRLLDWLTFYVSALCQTVRLPPQDVIVCLTTPPYIALAGVLHKLLNPQTKLVLWNMDCYPEALERTGMIRPGGWVSRIMRAINRGLFRRVDHLVCLDPAMRDLLQQYATIDHPLACSVIPNWESADLFPARTAAMKWDHPVVESLGGKFVVLYLGNAGYGHEFATTIDAAAALRDDPVVFLFVGGGARRPWIIQQAERRGLTNIVLLDYVPKDTTPAVMGVANCALTTLENYAAGVMSPSKLHSNLAMGLPVLYIGPGKTNVDEAVARFGCGVSVRPGDTAAVVGFVRELLHDPARESLLRERARTAFETTYSDARALPQFDEAFQELLNSPLTRDSAINQTRP
ncbi:MAG TPA: glycosyltransferase family 4 protein [Tepidisphaeraceae bacterium]|nr:glycosyltransferase family 4 protein [Tepidisphaeraceae bacterium]